LGRLKNDDDAALFCFAAARPLHRRPSSRPTPSELRRCSVKSGKLVPPEHRDRVEAEGAPLPLPEALDRAMGRLFMTQQHRAPEALAALPPAINVGFQPSSCAATDPLTWPEFMPHRSHQPDP
jgi:hypothetical protein